MRRPTVRELDVLRALPSGFFGATVQQVATKLEITHSQAYERLRALETKGVARCNRGKRPPRWLRTDLDGTVAHVAAEMRRVRADA